MSAVPTQHQTLSNQACQVSCSNVNEKEIDVDIDRKEHWSERENTAVQIKESRARENSATEVLILVVGSTYIYRVSI